MRTQAHKDTLHRQIRHIIRCHDILNDAQQRLSLLALLVCVYERMCAPQQSIRRLNPPTPLTPVRNSSVFWDVHKRNYNLLFTKQHISADSIYRLTTYFNIGWTHASRDTSHKENIPRCLRKVCIYVCLHSIQHLSDAWGTDCMGCTWNECTK